jgi:hypothetical protein
MYLVVLS